MTRPASRARRWRWVGGTVLYRFWSSEINLIEVKKYQYQNVYYWFKIKTLFDWTNQIELNLKGKIGYFPTKSSFWTKVTTTQPYKSESWNPLGLKLMRCFACRLPPQIFQKWPKSALKYPRFWSDFFFKAVFKVYRNPRVQTELAETFTIARTFNYLNFDQRKPASIYLGARNRGISKKRS